MSTRFSKMMSVRRPTLVSRKVLIDSLVRLNPLRLIANPVMLIVEITFFIVAAMAIHPEGFPSVASPSLRLFYVEVALILLFTVWFSTLSDALAERQAKNTANSLRRLEMEVSSKKILIEAGSRQIVPTPSRELRKGDLILLEKNDTNQMIRMVESSKRPKTPNEQAVTIVLIGLTAIFTILIGALLGISLVLSLAADLSVLIALYVCLLPTTIGALLPSIGLSGISRLYKEKIVAKSGRAVETAGDTDVILLDKTGTITVGNRQAVEFIPFPGFNERDVGEAAFLASWHDDTPEGRSLIRLSYEDGFVPKEMNSLDASEVYEFSASTRTSGVKLAGGTGFMLPKSGGTGRERGRLRRKFEPHVEGGVPIGSDEIEIIKGAPDAIKKIVKSVPADYDKIVQKISAAGDTAMALSRNREAIGIVRLRDVLKPDIKEKIMAVKVMGIRPVMITGDQPLTAKSIAAEVGIDEFQPEAKPEDKYDIVKREQAETRIVAMIGDGTNDAPALAMADVGLAMNSGTQAAKEAANMVDLESNPAKIIEVVMLGKQLLMTRGAVTTFSIANDVAKYFAIVPVMFAATLPELKALNILGLGLNTAVLSALIFNAAIIPLLIPLAMKGIRFKPTSTMSLFIKNALIYGAGGIIVPFIGIKLIDIALLSIGG